MGIYHWIEEVVGLPMLNSDAGAIKYMSVQIARSLDGKDVLEFSAMGARGKDHFISAN